MFQETFRGNYKQRNNDYQIYGKTGVINSWNKAEEDTIFRLVVLVNEAKPFRQAGLLSHSAFLQHLDGSKIVGIDEGSDAVQVVS